MVRLDNFLYNKKMRNILCQKGGNMNPTQWMNEGKIVIFNLSNGTFTEAEQRMLMALHNMMFWNATLAREEKTKKGIEPKPFHLIYDEPQTYINATPMFSRAISKARKYRVSLSFFIQEAEQIIKEAPALWKEILGMSPHLMIGPVSETTAKHVQKELGVSVEEIMAIKNHKFYWLLKTYVNKEAVKPVVVKTCPPRHQRELLNSSHVEEVKAKSRALFCQLPKEELNADITARSMGITLEEYYKKLSEEDDVEVEETAENLEWE
jgi:hypothetical protein